MTTNNTPLPEWLDDLNGRQREAALHESGPLLVIAGAGSGKTKTLAYRVAMLIERGVAPEKILLLTFTRRAASEMLSRAGKICSAGNAISRKVWGGTFHSVANRILRTWAKSVGLSPEFTIIDQSDAQDMLNKIRFDLGLAGDDRRFPRKSTCLSIYSRRVNGHEDLLPVLKRSFPWCEEWHDDLKRLFKEYTLRKQKLNILDYDDLLLYWYYLLEDESIAGAIESRFEHILVDEYQDTNRIQADILKMIRKKNKNIMVVGDDAQSIYSFRCATIENILSFPNEFAAARVVTLDCNYRSTQPILDTTNALIGQARLRYEKNLWSPRKSGNRPSLTTCFDETEQDEYIIRRVLEHREQGIPLNRQAVLFRTAHHANSLELALSRRNIPFIKYGGLKYLEAAHIKDILSFMKVLENHRDEIAWFRILHLIDGIGPASAQAAIDHLAECDYSPAAVGEWIGPPAARETLAALGGLFRNLTDIRDDNPSSQMELIAQVYGPLLKRNYDNVPPRQADIEQLQNIARQYPTRSEFLSALALDPPNKSSDLAGKPFLEEDWLELSTIHSAKGSEWDVVFVIHASDGCLPSDLATGTAEEIEEELRLMYVAMTRARDFLYVTVPQRYYHRPKGLSDNHNYAQPSRFLTETVKLTMDSECTYNTRPDTSTESIEIQPRESIQSRMKSMWD